MPSDPSDLAAERPDDAPAEPRAVRTGLVVAVAVLALVVVAVDQLTKARALATLTPGERIDVLGDLLGLELVFNPGAALSIATGMTWVLTLVAVVVVVVVARAARRLGSRGWAVAFGLLLGGAAGNLIDRFARPPAPARGHVVDFIAYGDWFVGNVADIAIVLAAVLVVLQSVRGVRLDGTRERGAADVAADGAVGGGADGAADGAVGGGADGAVGGGAEGAVGGAEGRAPDRAADGTAAAQAPAGDPDAVADGTDETAPGER